MHNAGAGIVNLQSSHETISLLWPNSRDREQSRSLVAGDDRRVGEEDGIAKVCHGKGYTNRPHDDPYYVDPYHVDLYRVDLS